MLIHHLTWVAKLPNQTAEFQYVPVKLVGKILSIEILRLDRSGAGICYVTICCSRAMQLQEMYGLKARLSGVSADVANFIFGPARINLAAAFPASASASRQVFLYFCFDLLLLLLFYLEEARWSQITVQTKIRIYEKKRDYFFGYSKNRLLTGTYLTACFFGREHYR